jgi:O-acetyl-ADP-ribose deacetylase (regulator of RNase III)
VTKIKYLKQDLLSVNKGVIIHGVNTLGLFNAGIAKQIRYKYPSVYLDYMDNYSKYSLGDIHISVADENKYLNVIHAFNQSSIGRDPSRRYISYDAVFESFTKINTLCHVGNINTVYFPMIGSGLANGKWSIIEKIIETTLSKVENKNCCIV